VSDAHLHEYANPMASDQSTPDTLFGYEIPMPRSDLLIAIITVASFLPVVILVYRVVLGIRHLFTRDKRQ
jgi:hypothetical protein